LFIRQSEVFIDRYLMIRRTGDCARLLAFVAAVVLIARVGFAVDEAEPLEDSPRLPSIEHAMKTCQSFFENSVNSDIALRDSYWFIRQRFNGMDYERFLKRSMSAEGIRFGNSDKAVSIVPIATIGAGVIRRPSDLSFDIIKNSAGNCEVMSAALRTKVDANTRKEARLLFANGSVPFQVLQLDDLENRLGSRRKLQDVAISYGEVSGLREPSRYYGFKVVVTALMPGGIRKDVKYAVVSGLDDQESLVTNQRIPASGEVTVQPPDSRGDIVQQASGKSCFWFVSEGQSGGT
jgi:hypothetical protein